MDIVKEISTQFGRKKGLLHHVKAILQNRFGIFDKYKKIDYSRVKRVVFICKGNVCRSPFGEFKAKQMNIEAASAGIAVNSREPAHQWGLQAALAYGIDMAEHRSKSIYDAEIFQSDLLVAFEPWQAEWLTTFAARKNCQITLLGLHLRNEFPHVEDPLGLSPEYFKTCYARIIQGVDALARKISNANSNKTVLITEADSTGAVAVIRSLGRAGYYVLATSKHEGAIGFKSKFTDKFLISPSYDSREYIEWIRKVLSKYRVAAIIPSEGFLLAIKDHFEEFSSLIPFSTEKKVVYSGLSKCDLFSAVDDQHLPSHIIVDLESYSFVEIAKAVQGMCYPLFVKTDAIYAKTNAGGHVHQVTTIGRLSEILEDLSSNYRKCLIQEYVPGSGVGVFFVIWNKNIVSDFMHLRIHEVPYTGGVSSLRRSYFHQEIYDDAVKKCMQMQWQGPVMLEYRYEKNTGNFYLMEMNGRFWGSLHLPLYAGVDFPKILLDMYFKGMPQTPPAEWRNTRTISRQTFPLEIQHIWSVLKADDLASSVKVKSVIGFFLDTLNPAIKSDFFSFRGDRLLFFYTAKNMFESIARHRSLLKRIISRNPL